MLQQDDDKSDAVSHPGINSESERQLMSIVSFLPDATFAIDKKGRVIAWNRAMESMTGVKAAEILGRGDYEYSLPFYGFRRPILIDLVLQPDPHLEAEYESMERDGMAITGEVFISSFGKSGSHIWAKASPLYDSNGEIIGAIESLRDITERKKTEETLKESESKFRLLFERSADAMFLMDGKKFIDCNNAAIEMMKFSSRDGLLDIHPAEKALLESRELYRNLVENLNDIILFLDPSGCITYISPVVEQAFGYSPQELLGRSFEEHIHKDDLADAKERFEQAITGKLKNYEFRVLDRENRVRYVRASARLSGDPDSMKGLTVTIIDITDYKEVEMELRESEDRYRLLVESSPDGIIIHQDSTVIFANNAAAVLMGADKPEELVGQPVMSFVHPDYRHIVQKRIHSTQNIQDLTPLMEEKFLRVDGTLIDVEAVAIPFAFKGKPATQVVFRDIAKRKRAEADLVESKDSLKHSESKYRLLYSSLMDAFVSTDMNGKIIECNRSYLDMLGYEPDEINAFTYRDLTPDRWHSFEEEMVLKQILPRGYSDIYEKEYLRKDGTIFPVELRTFLLRDETGNPIGMSAIVRDITRRKYLEKMLIQERDKAKQLLDIAGVIILALDAEGIVTLINEKGCQILGCGKEEIVGKDWTETFLPNRIKDEIKINFKKLVSGELASVEHFENPILTCQGDERDITWQNSIIRDEDGSIVGTLSSGEDITERKQAESALMESEEMYRTLSEAAPDLVFIINKDDKVEYINNVAAKYLNMQPQDVIGRARSELFPTDVYNRQKLGLQKAFENGEAVRNSVDKATFCGKEVWLDTQMVPLRKNSGHVTAVLGVSRDITDLKRSEEILRDAKEAAEAATRAKSEFLANMSHEIRTPMNAVIGMTGLLLDEDLTTNQKECLETIRRSGDALLSIINNILDLSKIEAGVNDLEYQPFDLHRCVEASLDLVLADAIKKGISTKCEFEDNTPAVILGDPTRLSQILVNLISNAVKFTEKGEISVSVSGKRLAGENYEVHFAVRDTGIGIPEDKMVRLFQSFSQIDSSTTRKYGGTGLGLVISKKLVEMMKGTIWVESEPGRGTTFHFTINVEKTLHEPIDLHKLDSKSDARLQGNLGRHLSILLAEDNLINQMVTQRMLNKLGCRADIANNGIEVLRALERQSYDVIIMDVLMPEMDGLEATREIRRRWPGGSLKIIAMTASVLKGDRETCLAAGMDSYISKPTKLAELKSALESIVTI